MKCEIEVEGLPKGWRAVAFRNVVPGEFYFSDISNQICKSCAFVGYALIVQKIMPRRIVLEETDQDNLKYTSGYYANQCIDNGVYVSDQPKIWREVKEGE